MQTVTLTPLFKNSIGFDRFNDLFENAFSNTNKDTNSYPPYNIEKHGENHYRIIMAVAGFKPEELNVVAQDRELVVSGQMRDKDEVEYLHQGIATRTFQRSFKLADYMQVEDATIADGLLQIDLKLEIPEAQKPRVIEVQTTSATRAIEDKKAKKKAN